MANKQSVPSVGVGGAMLKTARKNTAIPVELKRELPVNNTLDMLGDLALGAGNVISFIMEYQKEQKAYQADKLLQDGRKQLQAANSMEEFDQLASSFEGNMKSQFMNDSAGKNFWVNNGDKILEAHRADVARIREQKNIDFARQGLTSSLADNQNLLAEASGDKGRLLIDRGLSAIESAPFLGGDEKEIYRSGFVRNGILNLALNDPDAAISYADKYVTNEDERDKLKQRLNEAKNLREASLFKTDEEQKRVQAISEYGQQLSLWAEKERGNISDAEFYVLTAEGNDGSLAKASEAKISAPLNLTYQMIKKMSRGEALSAEEARDAGQALISAYKQNKIGLEEAADLQNKVMSAASDKTLASKYFDPSASALADKVLLPDIEAQAGDTVAEKFMERKAQLMFEINDVYNAKREALMNVFSEQGGHLTPAYERRFNQQALRETRDELGLIESSKSDLSFASLRRFMGTYYTGHDEDVVWRRFCDEAPYTDNKKALLKKIASEEERRELSYPSFDTFAEVEAAGLEKGERFYLRGRLAEKV